MFELPLGLVPLPSTEDQRRMMVQARRRRILTGKWRPDLVEAMRVAVGTDRTDAWRLPDLSSNPARQFVHAVSELYTKPPTVTNRFDARSGEIIEAVLYQANWVARMQRLQPLTVGVREGILRVDLVGDKIRLREVDPAYVTAVGSKARPGQPAIVTEYRRREDPRTMATDENGVPIAGTATRVSWVRETWNIRNATVVFTDETGEDVTDVHYPNADGYPYLALDREGEPRAIMPYVFYHAHDTGELFDYMENAEIFSGTLIGGVYWSFFGHRLRNASWPARYLINAVPSGIRPSTTYPNGDGRRDIVTADPATVLMLEQIEDATGQPMVGAFPDGGDLSAYAESVTMYDRHTIATAGIDASDIQRMDGDPRSGYALSLSQTGKRNQKRKYEPAFSQCDSRLAATVARILRGAAESGRIADAANYATLASGGYEIAYPAIGLTDDERRALVTEVTQLTSSGLMTPGEARQKLDRAGYFD